MPAIQPNAELDSLLEKVRSQVQTCGLQEAILVDDNFDTDVTEASWIEAVTSLRAEDKPAYEKLRQLIAAKGTGNVDTLPPDDIRDEAVGLVKDSSSVGARNVLNIVKFKEDALAFLVGILKEIGLTPTCRTRVTREDPPRTGKLYFIDYRMRGNDETAGLDASELLGDIVQKRTADGPPPAAVLMSRGQDQNPTRNEWEGVARNAGYYRFNFRYLDKEMLAGSTMPFLFFLHELLAALPLGKKYYEQLRDLRTAAGAAADAALAKIRQLTPAEFSVFAGKHLGDGSGRKASRHMIDLFLGLLDAEVKDNAALEASFRAFAEMLRSSEMLATTDRDSRTLNKLHHRVMYCRFTLATFVS